MLPRDLLRSQAEIAYSDLLESISGLTQEQAWAVNALQPGEYMHTEGSILSVVCHVAGGKFLFGSAGFRNLDVRWRNTCDREEALWPDWEAAKAYLAESHEYWMDSWSTVTDFERLVKTHSGKDWPAWRAITVCTLHDCYHTGQIHLLRTTLAPTSTPPPPEAELNRSYCKESPSW